MADPKNSEAIRRELARRKAEMDELQKKISDALERNKDSGKSPGAKNRRSGHSGK